MIEAHIVCSSPCEIPDLGLVLQRGQEVWVADRAAQNSKDLRTEISKGNVRMSRQTRKPGQTVPRPLPPFVALNRSPGPGAPQATRPSAEPAKSEPLPQIDVDDIARRVRADLIDDVRASVAEEFSRVFTTMPQPSASVDESQLASVLEGVLRRVLPTGVPAGPSSRPQETRAAVDEGPLYMPTNIVDKEAKGKMTMETQSTDETDDLDDAAAALRRLKQQRSP